MKPLVFVRETPGLDAAKVAQDGKRRATYLWVPLLVAAFICFLMLFDCCSPGDFQTHNVCLGRRRFAEADSDMSSWHVNQSYAGSSQVAWFLAASLMGGFADASAQVSAQLLAYHSREQAIAEFQAVL